MNIFVTILFNLFLCFTLSEYSFALSINYTCDSLSRLTEVDYGNGYSIQYTYDPAGNRLTLSEAVSRKSRSDGRTDFAVWRQDTGYWYILRSSDSVVTSRKFGLASVSDGPVPGDYDGDGKTDFAVWRKDSGYWYILRSSDNVVVSQQWGLGSASDVPVPGDYDGDGKTDFAVWRQDTGYWYILRSSDSTVVSPQWGLASVSDVPVPGDYDGDGKTDFAVWRQDTGFWYILRSSDSTVYILRSSDSTVVSQQWGLESVGDVPIKNRY